MEIRYMTDALMLSHPSPQEFSFHSVEDGRCLLRLCTDVCYAPMETRLFYMGVEDHVGTKLPFCFDDAAGRCLLMPFQKVPGSGALLISRANAKRLTLSFHGGRGTLLWGSGDVIRLAHRRDDGGEELYAAILCGGSADMEAGKLVFDEGWGGVLLAPIEEGEEDEARSSALPLLRSAGRLCTQYPKDSCFVKLQKRRLILAEALAEAFARKRGEAGCLDAVLTILCALEGCSVGGTVCDPETPGWVDLRLGAVLVRL